MVLIAKFKDRDESHLTLEKVLATGEYPQAECREDYNDPEPYQVWSAPIVREPAPPSPPPPPTPDLSDEILDKLAEKLLAKMTSK